MTKRSQSGRWRTPPAILGPTLGAVLFELLAAWEAARRTQHSVWQFALGLDSFGQHAGRETALRWLLTQQHAQHRVEVTCERGHRRTLRPACHLALTEQSRFVLTVTGAEFARALLGRPESSSSLGPDVGGAVSHQANATLKPRWDADAGELLVCDRVVKRLTPLATCLRRILDAFEEEGWPRRIDDPLPRQPEQEPKQRLNHTLDNLNRRLQLPLLYFAGDGTGEGVVWGWRHDRDGKATVT